MSEPAKPEPAEGDGRRRSVPPGRRQSKQSHIELSPGRGQRMSTGGGGGGRGIPAGIGVRRGKIMYENTYRTEPMMKFRSDQALAIVQELFERRLKGLHYDPKVCQDTAKTLATEIKARVKDLKYDRYKYVVVVTIGQRQDSELVLASRCLLDTKWDTFATYNFESYHIFATGIVYAFFFE